MSERVQKFKLSAPSWRRQPGPNVLNRGCKHCGASRGISKKSRGVLAWRGEHWVCPLCSVARAALWPLSTLLYLAQLKRYFRNTRAHKSCLSLSRSLFACVGQESHWKPHFTSKESWSHQGLQPQGQTKRWIWDLAKPTCFWQNAFQGMIFPQRSCCDGWEEEGEEGERAVVSVAVAEPCRTWCWWLAPSAECWDTTAPGRSQSVLARTHRVHWLDVCPELSMCLMRLECFALGRAESLIAPWFCSFCWKTGLIFPCFLGDSEDKLASIHGSHNDREQTH